MRVDDVAHVPVVRTERLRREKKTRANFSRAARVILRVVLCHVFPQSAPLLRRRYDSAATHDELDDEVGEPELCEGPGAGNGSRAKTPARTGSV